MNTNKAKKYRLIINKHNLNNTSYINSCESLNKQIEKKIREIIILKEIDEEYNEKTFILSSYRNIL